MDAAEKSLFNRPMDDDRSDPKSTFRLHYFPKIPIAPEVEKGGGIHKRSDFRRTDCGKSGVAASVIFENSNPDGVSDENSKDGNKGLLQQAYAKGYRDGEAAGIKAEDERLESNLNHLDKLIAEIEETRTEVFRNAEKGIVNLAMAIAAKIIRHEISTKKEVIVRTVSAALKKPVDHENIKVRVNPSDYHFLKEQAFQFSNFVDNPGSVIFVEDESIERGGCMIETNLGDIDARIEKQLRAVEEALKSEFQKSNFTNSCQLK